MTYAEQSVIQDQHADAEADAVFVQEYVEHGDAMLACVRANIRDPRYPMDVIARQTLDRPEIRAAIAALSKIMKFRAPIDITRESVVADLQSVYERAFERDMLAQAVSAKKEQANLLGFTVQRIEVTHRDVNEMTEAQLVKIAGKSLITDAEYEEVLEDDDDDDGSADADDAE